MNNMESSSSSTSYLLQSESRLPSNTLTENNYWILQLFGITQEFDTTEDGNIIKVWKFHTRRLLEIFCIIVVILYFSFFGVSVKQAENSAKAPESFSTSVNPSNDGWVVANAIFPEFPECFVAISQNPKSITGSMDLSAENSATLELSWGKFIDTQSGGIGTLNVAMNLGSNFVNDDQYPPTSAYTIGCYINSNLYSLKAGDQNLLKFSYEVPFPIGSNNYYPLDYFELSNLKIQCFASSTDPDYPVLQRSRDLGGYYTYPQMIYGTSNTTTGMQCTSSYKTNFTNNPVIIYDCPNSYFPVFLNYYIKFSSQDVSGFKQKTTINVPVGDPCYTSLIVTTKTIFYRQDLDRFLPIILTIGQWILFFGNTIYTMFPILFNNKEVSEAVIAGSGSLIFVQNSIYSTIGKTNTSIIYYAGIFWIQILSITQFFFLTYKFIRGFVKKMKKKNSENVSKAI